MSPRDTDDEIAEANWQARRARRGYGKCQCGDDLPGYCPGPVNCPHSDYSDGAYEAREAQIKRLEGDIEGDE